MSPLHEPPRLTEADEGSDLLRSLVREAQNDAPSEATSAALARRLAPLRTGAPLPASGSGAGLGVKVTGLVVVGALAVLGARALWHRPVRALNDVAASSATPAPAPPSLVENDKGPDGEPASVAEATSAATTAAPAHHAPRHEAPSASASAGVEDPEADVRLIERAQDALRRDPAAALTLTGEHARRFPHSMLAQEREMITIEALARSGRGTEGRARAERFVRRFPRSGHRHRLETLFGTGFDGGDATGKGPAGSGGIR